MLELLMNPEQILKLMTSIGIIVGCNLVLIIALAFTVFLVNEVLGLKINKKEKES